MAEEIQVDIVAEVQTEDLREKVEGLKAKVEVERVLAVRHNTQYNHRRGNQE